MQKGAFTTSVIGLVVNAIWTAAAGAILVFAILSVPEHSGAHEETKRSIEEACAAVHRFHAEKGSYPDSLETLVAEGYLASIPEDGWGAELHYERHYDATEGRIFFDVRSFGPDAEQGKDTAYGEYVYRSDSDELETIESPADRPTFPAGDRYLADALQIESLLIEALRESGESDPRPLAADERRIMRLGDEKWMAVAGDLELTFERVEGEWRRTGTD